MNERIRLLAEQAGIRFIPMILDDVEYDYEDVEMDGSDDLQKFTDLIVGECCAALNPVLRDMISRGQGVDLIKQHFGVEE
jgi:hypothetical protein